MIASLGFHWDPIRRTCVRDVIDPPSPTPARQPAPKFQFSIQILELLCLLEMQGVARRFLKVERTYTNNQGRFACIRSLTK